MKSLTNYAYTLCQSPKTICDFLPISVMPILSSLCERYIVHNYLLPALGNFDLSDQFAFKTTGSTTAPIIFIMHHLKRWDTNEYIRCLVVDFSKGFDTFSHAILIKKLKLLNLPTLILNWIIRFHSDRTQTVIINGQVSSRLKINQSNYPRIGNKPHIIRHLCPWPKNVIHLNLICKHADNTSILTPQQTNIRIEEEILHLQSWAKENRLKINTLTLWTPN